jgi:hypothetical protein
LDGSGRWRSIGRSRIGVGTVSGGWSGTNHRSLMRGSGQKPGIPSLAALNTRPQFRPPP